MTAPADIHAAVKAVQANAKQLGLIWEIRPGTLLMPAGTTPPDPAAFSVLLDGDDTAIPAVLLGALTNPRRVWVMTVPPSGFYIVGSAGSLSDLVAQDHEQNATAAIAAETAVLTGGSVNFYPGAAYRVKVGGQLTNAAANTTSFRLRRDTVTGTVEAGTFNEQRAAALASWFEFEFTVVNLTGSTITFAPCITMATSASTTTMDGAATRSRYLEVRFAGFAGQFPNAVPL